MGVELPAAARAAFTFEARSQRVAGGRTSYVDEASDSRVTQEDAPDEIVGITL